MASLTIESVKKMNTPAISLLLCSMPRMLLRVACRFVRSFSPENKLANAISPKYKPSWDNLLRKVHQSAVDVEPFEKFLGGLTHYAKEAYKEKPGNEQTAIENTFILDGKIPEVLEPLATRLVTSAVDKLIEDGKIDPMALYKTDVTPLRLTDDDQTSNAWKDRKQCCFRKIDLPRGVRSWRKCVRCHRMAEDITDPKTLPRFLLTLQRSCICGSAWLTVDRSS